MKSIFRIIALAASLTLCCSFPAAAQTNFTLVTSFTGNTFGQRSARTPICALIEASDGLFYGTTGAGGISNRGTVFRLKPDGTDFVILKSFLSSDGRMPFAGVVEGNDGILYGTTSGGGAFGNGTIFKLNRDGSNFTVLRSFQSSSDGSFSMAPLVQGSDSAFYGTAELGGTNNSGTIFKINSDGGGFTVLRHMGGTNGSLVTSKLLASAGLLYGVAGSGGVVSGAGTVFRLSEDGTGFAILRQFLFGGADGSSPSSGLMEASDHALYGSTGADGAFGGGTIFKMNKDGGGFATIFDFGINNGDPKMVWEFVESNDGTLYGSSNSGGITNHGTCFKINKDGSGYIVLRRFLGTGGDGLGPEGALLQARNGAFYGTTLTGGEFNQGCIYALSSVPLPSRVVGISNAPPSKVVQFAATSDFQYDVQRSTNLTSWSTLGTTNAPYIGRFDFLDLSPPPGFAFYRLKLH